MWLSRLSYGCNGLQALVVIIPMKIAFTLSLSSAITLLTTNFVLHTN